jgi:hypothetical protein
MGFDEVDDTLGTHNDLTATTRPETAAGWYPDPHGRPELRYWDGSAWTEHVSATDHSPASTPTSGTGIATQPDPTKPRTVALLVGGALMAVGALLPWEQVKAGGITLLSEKGTSAGSGVTVMIAGGVIACLAFFALKGALTNKAYIATLVLSIIGFVLLWMNFSSISDDIDTAKQGAGSFSAVGIEGTIGAGLFVAFAGSLLAGVTSTMLLKQKAATTSTLHTA